MTRHRHRSDPATGWGKFRWMFPAVVAICVGFPATAQDTATYRVTFTGNWTLESTPGGVVPSAHFTMLIGAIHNGDVTFWESGGTASPGIESMAETGGTSTLRREIEASPHVHAVIQQSVSFGGTGTARFNIDVPKDHPLITLTSMIGPSPDWFVGVSGLSLLDGQGEWQATVQVNLYPYDAGTEDGTEFTLSNPDTNPQGTITSIRGTGKFSNEPMARLSFVLDTTSQPPGQVTGVAITPGIGALTVSWNRVDDADGYRVQWRSGSQTFGAARQRTVGSSATRETIPNLTPGVQYFVRVIATKTGASDGTPSNAEIDTPLANVNRPPDLLAAGDTATVDLTTLFTGTDGETLTYAAESSDPELLTVRVEGTNLVLLPNDIGEGGVATVTVTATDADDLTATLSFVVTIEANPRGFLRGWRKGLFKR